MEMAHQYDEQQMGDHDQQQEEPSYYDHIEQHDPSAYDPSGMYDGQVEEHQEQPEVTPSEHVMPIDEDTEATDPDEDPGLVRSHGLKAALVRRKTAALMERMAAGQAAQGGGASLAQGIDHLLGMEMPQLPVPTGKKRFRAEEEPGMDPEPAVHIVKRTTKRRVRDQWPASRAPRRKTSLHSTPELQPAYSRAKAAARPTDTLLHTISSGLRPGLLASVCAGPGWV